MTPAYHLFGLEVVRVFFQRDPLFSQPTSILVDPNPCQDFLIELRFFECQSDRCYFILLQKFLSDACPVALFLDSKLLHLRHAREAPAILVDCRPLALRVGLRC